MQESNLDVVRAIYADWGRGDFARSDWADPDIEFVYVGGPEPTASRGIAAMDAAWREWLRGWEGFRAEPFEYRAIDDGRILVLVRNRGRGKLSGLEFEERSVGNYFELKDGRVTKLVVYLDGARALSDLGFQE
jgi:ketosteroid isomerase-like protein